MGRQLRRWLAKNGHQDDCAHRRAGAANSRMYHSYTAIAPRHLHSLGDCSLHSVSHSKPYRRENGQGTAIARLH
ncbi:hypothetical protein CFBP6762_03471 [Xanthomonas arboricola pv. fragariae]|uniref:Uncharacterized protein n=1 Tax=Xanthomonas arboricola TaxID=56448 RepID=A0AAU9HZA3_9XANT|nr:hypothetical protein XA1314C_27130 [Xanthomonas arboricola]CAE6794688.1 hypothetical protein XA1314C_27130 [Xanthomonas arboricola]SOU03244.1 hypothetical protein CFBP6762_03471 [Xanthomonas arboricola pv. fragariae]